MDIWGFIKRTINIERGMNFNETIILENTRVKLEPLKPEHFDSLLAISLAHPNLLQYSPSPFGTKEKLETYLEMAFEGKRNEVRYPFIIWDKESQSYVGSTSYGNISVKNSRLEIGWTWLDKKVQGTGLNLYAKHLLLKYAFDTLKFERVELKTDARNLQSRKAIEKIGAKFEGILRSHTLMTDGYRRDTVYYGILKEEWQNINQSIFKGIN